jgi:hypothetical protein
MISFQKTYIQKKKQETAAARVRFIQPYRLNIQDRLGRPADMHITTASDRTNF